jgi:hypothetical protein
LTDSNVAACDQDLIRVDLSHRRRCGSRRRVVASDEICGRAAGSKRDAKDDDTSAFHGETLSR